MLAPLAALTLTLAADLGPVEKKIRAFVDDGADDAVALVESVSRINSGTLSPEGVRAVGAVFEARLKKIGFETKWIAMPESMKRGGHLFATRRGTRGKRLLLIGHLDTVFEADDPFQKVRREGGELVGPGVYDMKGGDVVILAALEALHAAGALEHTTIVVALIGDEEKPGHPRELARRDLVAAAESSDIALGFEPGMAKDAVSIARRGSSGWRAVVEAKGGHSSGVGSTGAGHGAIYEAARFLDAVRKWSATKKSITINPGLFVGGTDASTNKPGTTGRASGKSNKIAAVVKIGGDLRFLTEQEKAQARAAMKKIAAQALPHAKVALTFSDGYPAMPPSKQNRALFDQLDRVNRDLGYGRLKLVPPESRGAADISFAAPHVAALAGLGPAGSGAHTRDERMDIEHLAVATARAALLIHRLTR